MRVFARFLGDPREFNLMEPPGSQPITATMMLNLATEWARQGRWVGAIVYAGARRDEVRVNLAHAYILEADENDQAPPGAAGPCGAKGSDVLPSDAERRDALPSPAEPDTATYEVAVRHWIATQLRGRGHAHVAADVRDVRLGIDEGFPGTDVTPAEGASAAIRCEVRATPGAGADESRWHEHHELVGDLPAFIGEVALIARELAQIVREILTVRPRD